MCPSRAGENLSLRTLKNPVTLRQEGTENMSYGYGFGFRGNSPPWPYVGRGRGGLPRCRYPGAVTAQPYVPSFYGRYPAWGAMPYPHQTTREQELDFLKERANTVRKQLENIEARIKELQAKQE